MLFTHDVEEWLLEINLWTRREWEDLIAALRRGSSVGMFEFAYSANGQRCFIMTAHVNCVLVLASSQSRSDLVTQLTRPLDGDHDSSLLAYTFFPPTSAAQTGTASRLM